MSHYSKTDGTIRPYRLWDSRSKKHVPYRFYSVLDNAHIGAMIEAKRAKEGTVIELYNAAHGTLIQQYLRGEGCILFPKKKSVKQAKRKSTHKGVKHEHREHRVS